VSGTVQSNNTPPAPSQEGNENLTALLSRGELNPTCSASLTELTLVYFIAVTLNDGVVTGIPPDIDFI